MTCLFYQINSSLEKKYCYAYKDLSVNGINYDRCPICSRTIASYDYSGKPHQFLLEGGKTLPDLLGFHGAGTDSLIISLRALQVFRTHNVSGINHADPVCVLYPFSNKNGDAECFANQYFMIQITGHIDLHYPSMQLKKKRYCIHCGQFEWNRKRFHPMYLDTDTWDGSDMCQISSMSGYKICSDKIVELVKQHKLTGFSFAQINAFT